MECLSFNQIVLYLTEYGLDDIQKKTIEKHFDECENCWAQKEIQQNKFAEMISDNQLECETVEQNLVGFFLGDADEAMRKKIEKHLQDCVRCQFLFKKLKQSPAPEHRIQKIYTQITKLPAKVRDVVNKIQDQLITVAILTAKPLKAAPVFLGKHGGGEKKITHAQGDIILNVGQKNKNVKLLSPNNAELDAQKSDENGIVVFKDFIGGDYQVQMDGFEITNIEYHTPS